MARNPQVTVEPRPGGFWAVQTDGTQRAYRVYGSKSQAERTARSVAKNKATELVIKNDKGKIVSKDSHGNDSRKARG